MNGPVSTQRPANGATATETERGSPAPFGALRVGSGVNFAVYSRSARRMSLVLHPAAGEVCELPLEPQLHRTGHVWHVLLPQLDPGFRYAWRVDGRAGQLLLDPYARSVVGRERFGLQPDDAPPRLGWLDEQPFDWGRDHHPRTPWHDTVIYELQVRGFSRDASAAVAAPGTYAGIIEKIPHLLELGVTAVELLPLFEFEEDDRRRVDPGNGERLLNVWGYQPLAFMAPKASFAADTAPGAAGRELKALVKAMHAAGIEVILDVVFNHTGEGEAHEPAVSWRGLDEGTYYTADADSGRYMDFTGCGNTFNCNHPVSADLIVDSLRHWVAEYHVDGFRFDLASVLCRAPDGAVLDSAPLVERIAADGVLADTKLIAEPWDATGFYQLGHFPGGGRFAQWNDRFRDDVRRFVRGDAGFAGTLASRLAGSADLFSQRGQRPWNSINFITCHDGFTLRDLVSYSHKHNMRNGEQGRDGTDSNWSWNCGEEGESGEPQVLALRERQMRNLLTLLLLASGTPMLLAGDEFGNSQHGNNNAYCQDNPVGWLDWSGLESHAGLHRFVRELLAFRRRHPGLRRSRFDAADDQPVVRWHGVQLDRPDWAHHSHTLAMEVQGRRQKLYLVANGYGEALDFELPTPLDGGWRRIVDTARPAPDDISAGTRTATLYEEPVLAVQARSVVVLFSG